MAVKRYTQFYIKRVLTNGAERRTRGVNQLSTAITFFGHWLMDRCDKLKKDTTYSVGIYQAAFFEEDDSNISTVETPVFVIKRDCLDFEGSESMYLIESGMNSLFEKEL